MSVASELRAKSGDELKVSLIALKKEQFNLRFQKANMQLENTARIRQVRREIARIKSVMTQKASADAAKGEA